jgi:Rieske Fe-S protein
MKKQEVEMTVEAKEMTSVDLQRRLLLKATGAAAGCCALPAGTAHAEGAAGPAKGDLLVPAKGEATAPLKASDIKVGVKPVLVYPYDLNEKKAKDESRLNKLLLVRLSPAEMTDEVKARSVDGVVAYSAVCTHQGCDVTEFVAADKVLMCFCHFSKFNPADGTVAKGPATKSLVYVPLMEKDGLLMIAGGFSNKPGV